MKNILIVDDHPILREGLESPRTVDAHRVHIREKLGLSAGTELTRYAVRWTETGLIE